MFRWSLLCANICQIKHSSFKNNSHESYSAQFWLRCVFIQEIKIKDIHVSVTESFKVNITALPTSHPTKKQHKTKALANQLSEWRQLNVARQHCLLCRNKLKRVYYNRKRLHVCHRQVSLTAVRMDVSNDARAACFVTPTYQHFHSTKFRHQRLKNTTYNIALRS